MSAANRIVETTRIVAVRPHSGYYDAWHRGEPLPRAVRFVVLIAPYGTDSGA